MESTGKYPIDIEAPRTGSEKFLATNLEELRKKDRATYSNVITAGEIFRRLPPDFPALLCGSLGVAANTSENGYVFRPTDDLNMLVPRDRLAEFFSLILNKKDAKIEDYDKNGGANRYSYGTRIPEGLMSLARRIFTGGQIFGVSLHVNTYDPGDGETRAKIGTSSPDKSYFRYQLADDVLFEVYDQYPIPSVDRKLMEIPVRTPPRDYLLRIVKEDARITRHAHEDLQRLKESDPTII